MGNNEHINGSKWKWNATKEVGSFLSAEMLSIGVSIGAFTFLDEIAPDSMKKVSKVVAKTCVEPYLDTIEKGMINICRSKDCDIDTTKSRSERAEIYANYITRFGVSLVAGIVTEFIARSKFNKVLAVDHPAENKHVFGIDKAVHLGALAVVNTVGAKQTDDAIDTTTGILQTTLGWSKERAHKAADSIVRWEASNLFSSIVAAFYIIKRQFNNSGMHR